MLTEINLTENGLFVFENLPSNTEVGIDYHSWYVGPHFKGISNIPPGLHFIFVSAVEKHEHQSPRTGFFIIIEPGDTIFRKYNQNTEDVEDMGKDQNNFSKNIAELARHMAPYPVKECKLWPSLISHVTPELLSKVLPKCAKINCLTEVLISSAGRRKHNAVSVDSRIAHQVDMENILQFTDIPSQFPPDLTAEEISQYCMDSSYFLEQLIQNCVLGELDILGELQLAFIFFLLGQVFDAFEHWKALVSLLTNCHKCLRQRQEFFTKFIEIITLHMEEIPDDYFIDITAQNNFLAKTFQSFFQLFNYPDGIKGHLLKKASILKEKLSTRFQWDFEEENDEDLPVIVES